ncbi:pyridoxal 5'-phosphate synthase glutaminase subunit PdxT [Deinococcus enclensis]|uniref:Pyridoxal 5'-phosphate synthase subunit PdxT n=2 Tax=Deinococcus TaxID=1298 RepID=A0A221SVR5_9DEIO|nr:MULTISPECIES: pyridoxal 5'-phosphate synthase glutaminase subunit PdxT [Deinococcus]ASN80749.1 pyridoxal 5'-phosphate synthase glutaminase subunit PdxT [Deinococcus ficus]MDP9762732.1 5'-phosphate synthase pdxT subunit [Deinococcus enclensis]
MAGDAPRVGVLALQGAFREHRSLLEGLGAQVTEVRLPHHLSGLNGLVLPGGESTTMANLLSAYGLWDPIRAFHAAGNAMWGTCAGAILLAREVEGAPPQFGGRQDSLGLLDVTVQRNAFGRQVDSFSAPLSVQGLSTPFPGVFIRAPLFRRTGQDVQVLARHGEDAVMVRQGRALGTVFHPELTRDARVHELFLNLCPHPLPA